jgi:hypothetical protein
MRCRGRAAVTVTVAAVALATLAGACQPASDSSSSNPPATSSPAPTITPIPPPLPGADAGFIAFGDAGMGDATQQQVADVMQTWVDSGHRVDALVEAGDDVYPDGSPSLFPATLDTPYASLRTTRPLWVALGNHDVQAGHGAEQLDYLGLPALPYAKTLAGVQLLFLDANHPDAAQKTWLEGQLAAPGPALRVVVFHQPAYSCGTTHGSTQAVIDNWVPTLEKYRVALVLNGHEHQYERFLSANGVTYVVSGGGGAAVYSRGTCAAGTPPTQFAASRHHFVGIEIDGSTLRLTVVARTGEVLDTATITR